MKIISGIYKGRIIEGYNIEGTRPTMDRVRESLFAIIQNYLPNSVVIDLFAGTGSLGLEALSQGANFVYFIDKNIISTKTISKTISNLNIKNCKIINLDFEKALETIDSKADIIFLDPPYKTSYIEKSLKKINELNILNPEGIIICESDDLNKIVYEDNYKKIKERKYGDKWVAILKQI